MGLFARPRPLPSGDIPFPNRPQFPRPSQRAPAPPGGSTTGGGFAPPDPDGGPSVPPPTRGGDEPPRTVGPKTLALPPGPFPGVVTGLRLPRMRVYSDSFFMAASIPDSNFGGFWGGGVLTEACCTLPFAKACAKYRTSWAVVGLTRPIERSMVLPG